MGGGGGGRGQHCINTLLHINRLYKTESAIFVSLMCSLLPEDLHSELTFKESVGERVSRELSSPLVFIKAC